MCIFNMKHKKLRKDMVELLEILPESNREIFKCMYYSYHTKKKMRNFSEIEKLDIADIVYAIPDSSVKWAYNQIINSHMRLL